MGETVRSPIRIVSRWRDKDEITWGQSALRVIDQMQRTTRLMTTRISIFTCKLWNSPPATEAMSVDEGDELLVFFRRPWPFLQSHLVAARFPPHPCQLLAFDFGSQWSRDCQSCCFLSQYFPFAISIQEAYLSRPCYNRLRPISKAFNLSSIAVRIRLLLLRQARNLKRKIKLLF
jgi:hypothetical protein